MCQAIGECRTPKAAGFPTDPPATFSQYSSHLKRQGLTQVSLPEVGRPLTFEEPAASFSVQAGRSDRLLAERG